MLEIIRELQDTPIPLILVAAGIIFLFLALSGGIYGKIQIPAPRQKWAGSLGAVLLLVGTVLAVPGLLQDTPSVNGEPPQTGKDEETQQLKAERARLEQEAERIRAEREQLAQEEERRRREAQAQEQAQREQAQREAEAQQRRSESQSQERGGADLFVSEFSLQPKVPVQGEPVRVRIGVYNRGSKPAGAFTVQWWAGKNFPEPEHEWRVDSMSAKGGRILTHTYRGYRSWYGQLTTKVVIDPKGMSKDVNRQNNVYETNIQVRKR